MLELYTAATPNGKKVPILLAELNVEWTLHKIDLSKGDQKKPEYLAINPNGKIPALVDVTDDKKKITVFESGAILQYVAEKFDRFLPKEKGARFEVLSWVYWQIGGVGPMFGQLGAFGREEPRNEKAFTKFLDETKRLAKVLDGQLANREFVAGAYSIADMACFPWFDGMASRQGEAFEGLTNLASWMNRMRERPAVKKGMELEGGKSAT